MPAAQSRQIPAIYVKCRGGGGVARRDLKSLHRGVENYLRWCGCVRGPVRSRLPQKSRTMKPADAIHPAPIDGLFEPTIRLNQRVRKGQSLGQVFALDRVNSAPVRATRTGRVVLLRRRPAVTRDTLLGTLASI